MEERRRIASRWISRAIFSDVIIAFSFSSSFIGVSSTISCDEEVTIDVFDSLEIFFNGVFSTLVNDELKNKFKIKRKILIYD